VTGARRYDQHCDAKGWIAPDNVVLVEEAQADVPMRSNALDSLHRPFAIPAGGTARGVARFMAWSVDGSTGYSSASSSW
jgi:hypothetical protein